MFLGAIRAYTALNDLHKTSQIGTILYGVGAGYLGSQSRAHRIREPAPRRRKKAERPIEQGRRRRNSAKVEDAKKRLGAIENVLVATLTKLAGRQQLSLTGMAFVGDASRVPRHDRGSRPGITKDLQRAESDPSLPRLPRRRRREFVRN